jgi:hypothetical protein
MPPHHISEQPLTLTQAPSILRHYHTQYLPRNEAANMASNAVPIPKLDRYVVIHVATTCDEHGVYVTKDSAEVIELGWILLDSKNCDEVRATQHFTRLPKDCMANDSTYSCIARAPS